MDATYYAQSNLNVRSGPSTSYGVVTTIPYGAAVTVSIGVGVPWGNVTIGSPHIEGDNLWVFVKFNGKQGWAAYKYEGKFHILGTEPADKPKSPTDSKKPADKLKSPTDLKKPNEETDTPPPQAKESNFLPIALGLGAVAFLVMALMEKK